MTEPNKIRATNKDGEGEKRMLLAHPMENGLRKEADGSLVPAHYIRTLTIAINSKPLIEGSLGPGVSKSPLFAFRLTDIEAGDKVTVTWVDNRGERRSDETIFA